MTAPSAQQAVANALTKGLGRFWRREGEGIRGIPYRYLPLPKPRVNPPSPAENPQHPGGGE